MLAHDVRDSVGHHLKRSATVHPTERDALVQKVQPIPVNSKHGSVNRVDPKVPKGPGHINFVYNRVLFYTCDMVGYVINSGKFQCKFSAVK